MKTCYVDYTQELVSCIGEPELRSGRREFKNAREAKDWIKDVQSRGYWKFIYAAVHTSEIIVAK